jgi:hypothetical protein
MPSEKRIGALSFAKRSVTAGITSRLVAQCLPSFESIPLWAFLAFILYTLRRVDCRRCGVVAVEEVPWSDGKRTLDTSLANTGYCWSRISLT